MQVYNTEPATGRCGCAVVFVNTAVSGARVRTRMARNRPFSQKGNYSRLRTDQHNGHSQQHTCAFRSIPHPLATMCAARAASLAARQVARLCESFFELCTRNFFCGLTGSSWMSTWLVLLAGMVCPSSASKSIVDSWSMLPAALWTAMHNTQATAAASPSCIFSDYVARNATCGASPAWYCAWHGACFLYPVPPTS